MNMLDKLRALSAKTLAEPPVQVVIDGLQMHLRNALEAEAPDLDSAYIGFLIAVRMMDEPDFGHLDAFCRTVGVTRAELFTVAISHSRP